MKGLFKSTARYYVRYRPGYSKRFFTHIAKQLKLDGSGVLLDLGCGNGQLAIPFAHYFEKVIAMDPEPEMLKEGKRLAKRVHVKNIIWKKGSSNDLRVGKEKFRMVVIGRAFHWMDRRRTLEALYKIIEPGGAIVIVGERTQDSVWQPKSRWKKAVKATIQKYLGEERRAGDGPFKVTGKKFVDFIRESSFKRPAGFYDEDVKTTWSVNEVIGYLYSMSFSSKALLGRHARAFEKDLRRALLKANPSGKFVQKTHWAAVIAKRK